MNTRATPVSIGELEAMLMAQEEMLEKFKKSDGIIQVNLAQQSQQPQRFCQTGRQDQRFTSNSRGQNFRGRGGKHGKRDTSYSQCST